MSLKRTSFKVVNKCVNEKYGSFILKDSQMDELLTICELSTNPDYSLYELIYRASEHGFGAADFHFRCDNKPKTLTVIKSNEGNVFGGFTVKEWGGKIDKNGFRFNKNGERVAADRNALIFSFINKYKKPLIIRCQYDNESVSIKSSRKTGPVFGDNELFICDHSNTKYGSSSNLGLYYTIPVHNYGSDEAQELLAGSSKFLTTEIEVYKYYLENN